MGLPGASRGRGGGNLGDASESWLAEMSVCHYPFRLGINGCKYPLISSATLKYDLLMVGEIFIGKNVVFIQA